MTTELNKATLRQIEARLADAFKGVAAEFGVQIAIKGGSFSAASALLKLEIATVASDGQVQSREVQDWHRYAARFGLKPECLGMLFTQRGRTFKVTGLNPKAVAYPILAECGGKTFKFPVDAIKRLTPSDAATATPVSPVPSFLQGLRKSPNAFTTEKELLDAIENCDCELSPENLTCDGELSPSQVARKRAEIMTARNWLEKKLGRSVVQS